MRHDGSESRSSAGHFSGFFLQRREERVGRLLLRRFQAEVGLDRFDLRQTGVL